MRHILHKRDCDFIIEEYEANNSLSGKSERLLIRTVAQYTVNALKGQQPSVRQKRSFAKAIQALFPNIFSNVLVLVARNSRGGKLSMAFKSAATRYEKLHDFGDDPISDISIDSNMDINFTDNGVEDIESNQITETDSDQSLNEPENEPDEIQFLRSAVVNHSTIRTIKNNLVKTVEYRRLRILEGDQSMIFDIYKQDPSLILFEFVNFFPESDSNIIDKVDVFSGFVNNYISESKKNINGLTYLNDDAMVFQKFMFCIGRIKRGAKNAVEAFTQSVDEHASPEEVVNVCQKYTHPFIIARTSSPPQYIISLDSQPIPLSAEFNFVATFDLLLKLYYVFHIEFSDNLSKFFSFFADVYYNLTEINVMHSTLLDVKEKYLAYEQELEDNEENSEMDTDDDDDSDEQQENSEQDDEMDTNEEDTEPEVDETFEENMVSDEEEDMSSE